ncbi:DUF1761 domain-containing protein [Subsaxibacter sp. CAU 1640]|nr:DUF1761 domain-containing protein [Subsaxibacter sp. CAU 1640]MCK7589494.1 DUF1761 domain-containing protein [Subsaxibacter sp. CAU 1640]
MEMNYLAMAVAALTTLVVGFIWYHPKVFGTAWMHAAGLTEEELKNGNMLKIFGLTIVLSFVMTIVVMMLTVHQVGAYGMIGGMPTDETLPSFQVFMDDYGTNYRTFKHGTFHGFLAGLFFVLPIVAINGLFEHRSAKYIFINAGYWIVSLMLMGGIICGWV